jgi:hypothetical protein
MSIVSWPCSRREQSSSPPVSISRIAAKRSPLEAGSVADPQHLSSLAR